MSRPRAGGGRCLGRIALGVATAGLACGAGAEDAAGPVCVAAFVIDAVRVPPAADAPHAVPLGGISDLCFRPDVPGPGRLWAVTDRGPNGAVETPAGTRRTLLVPEFTPCLVELAAAPVREACAAPYALPPQSRPLALGVASVLPLCTRSGRPASGRSTGTGREAPLVDHATGAPLQPDPDGIDSEAVVALADGSFWIADEYGPALVHVGPDGRMLARLVPTGGAAPGAEAAVSQVLPAAYARRRDNRGFEALAALDGGRLLVALMQSPLETAAAGGDAGNVPLLVIDAATARPVAEHLYRAGDPADPRYGTHGCAPDDVKLCASTAAGDGLLVIEQGDDGTARLYAADLAGATNTLPRRCAGGPRGDAPALEAVVDLEAAAVVPVAKRLVADLGPLLPRWRADARLEADEPLKLEGLARGDARHGALVNDDDFGIHAGRRPEGPRSCLWVVRLAEPVPRPAAAAIPR